MNTKYNIYNVSREFNVISKLLDVSKICNITASSFITDCNKVMKIYLKEINTKYKNNNDFLSIRYNSIKIGKDLDKFIEWLIKIYNNVETL